MPSALRHLPNLITVLRIGACLPLAWLIVHGDERSALWLALAVGASDVLDGFLARRFNWQSRIGGLLDPIADKLFLVCAFIALGVAGAIPVWLIGLVILRDLLIVAGAFAYHRLVEPLSAAPSVIGKVNTLAQVGLILVVLAGRAGIAAPFELEELLVWIVAALAVISGGHYVYTWTRRAQDAWRRDRELGP